MSFLLTLIAVGASGLALLRVLPLATGHRLVDAPLAWLVGSGWFGLAAFALRFLAQVPFTGGTAAAIAATPPVAWLALRLAGRLPPAPVPPPGAPRPRVLPRPLWLFAPIGAYVVTVTLAVLLHGANTPTHNDDAVRVRAYTPVLAFEDAWPAEARRLAVVAGPVPTFVPAFAWIVTGTVDTFHVNYVVLADLVALLALAIGLGAAAGAPKRGWATAFAVLSVPLFVYHSTSTHQDGVLAIFVGAALLFVLEHGRTGDRRDALRALALALAAAMVKQEGELVAASVAAVVVASLLWRERRSPARPWRALGVALGVAGVFVAAKIAAVGLEGASALAKLLASRADVVPAVGVAAADPTARSDALGAFGYVLLRSGNAGMVYWLLPAALVVRWRAAIRPPFAWALAMVAVLFAEAAVTAVWLLPEFTMNQTTVHRALLVVSVPAAIWLAALIADGAAEPAER